jgi:hypothetical protein
MGMTEVEEEEEGGGNTRLSFPCNKNFEKS